jgi:hypothetical protein
MKFLLFSKLTEKNFFFHSELIKEFFIFFNSFLSLKDTTYFKTAAYYFMPDEDKTTRIKTSKTTAQKANTTKRVKQQSMFRI